MNLSRANPLPQRQEFSPAGNATRCQSRKDRGDFRFVETAAAINAELRRFRGFIWRTDAGEVGNLSSAGATIKPLGIARFADGQRRIHEHFDELSRREAFARHAALAAIGADETHQHDQACIHHQTRYFGDAADVFHAILLGEAKVAVEAVAHVVAIEHVRVEALRVQAFFHQIGERGFARTGQPGEPDAGRFLALDRRTRGGVHIKVLPVDVRSAPQREIDATRADGGVILAVDQDERAQRLFLVEWRERDGLIQREIHFRHFVQFQPPRCKLLLCVHIDAVLDLRHLCGDCCTADAQQIRAAGYQRSITHPQQMRAELIGNLRRGVGGSDHIASADIQFIGERERDGLPRHGTLQRAIGAEHLHDGAALRRRQHDGFHARCDVA